MAGWLSVLGYMSPPMREHGPLLPRLLSLDGSTLYTSSAELLYKLQDLWELGGPWLLPFPSLEELKALAASGIP